MRKVPGPLPDRADRLPLVTTRHSASRKSWPFILLAALCAAAVVGAVVGAPRPLSAAQFATTGHWVYNSVVGSVFHIDGATTNIDAQVSMEADVGSQVLQGDTSGYVVGPRRITEFDKASLLPGDSFAPPAHETALGIEAVGGPYVVYRNAGRIVRLGDPTTEILVESSIGNPVVTDDGTMWFHRNGDGFICTLGKDAVELAGCPVSAPKDHAGALTILDGRPAFVDLTTSQVHMVDNGTFGPGKPLGVTLSPNSRPAAKNMGGQLAILDPVRRSLVLVDTNTPSANPRPFPLPIGDYDGPVSTGEAVVLVDRQNGKVLTYGADGRKDEKPIKQSTTGQPRLSQGEDQRVYVEDSDGTQVLVVAKNGILHNVDVGASPVTEILAQEPPPDQPADLPIEPQIPVSNREPRPGTPDRPTRNNPAPVPASRPGAPPWVSARAGNGSATVTWGAAADNRAPVTSYQVSWQGGSTTVGAGARSATINGLTNGTRYVFTVSAINRVGAGPGSSSNAVTPTSPVSPAGPPRNLKATFDVDDRPTRDVTLTWQQPALNGGTLVHYEVTITGKGTRTVNGTSFVDSQVEADEVITYTVRAVTRAPDGQTLTGQAATATHRDTQGVRTGSATISQGGQSDTANCDPPECAWVNATMSGLDPNTTYRIRLSSNSNSNVRTESFSTNASGAATYNELNYDVPGQTVWVTVLTSSGQTVARSNSINWK